MPVVINEFEAVAQPAQASGDAQAKPKPPAPHVIRRDLRAVAWRIARVKVR